MLLHFRVFWGPIKKVSNQGQGTPVVHASEVDKQTFYSGSLFAECGNL